MWSRAPSPATSVASLVLVGLLIRLAVAFNGGIWADEAFFLLVAKIPSFRAMIDFLRYHESHPPLFYFVVRLWMYVAGTGETGVRILCALIGTSVIPAVYVAGRMLYSTRIALVAAVLVAFSSPLIEYTVQIRPYGLMTLLVVASCSSMILACEHGKRSYWVIYTVSTLLLLYTHNWAWWIAMGQQAAAITLAASGTREFKSIFVPWMKSWTTIALGFLPWSFALLYQGQHAGHRGLPFEGIIGVIELVIFGIYTTVETILFGSMGPRLTAVAGGIAIAVSSLVALTFHKGRKVSTDHELPNRRTSDSVSRAASIGMTVIVTGTLTIAILVSPFLNQLLARCIATLIPLFLLLMSRWVLEWTHITAPRTSRVIATASIMFLLTCGIIGLTGLLEIPRSNAREAANAVRNNMVASDVLVVMPEWFAPSFNNYFPPSIEQIDFPYGRRSGLIDFANVWARAVEPRPLVQLRERLAQVAASGRRVWLVSDARYIRDVSDDALRGAQIRKNPAPLSMHRVSQIRSTLESLYGPPNAAFWSGSSRPLYDDLRVYLYSSPGRRD